MLNRILIFATIVVVSNADRTMVRYMMRRIEEKTCVRFQEKSAGSVSGNMNMIKKELLMSVKVIIWR